MTNPAKQLIEIIDAWDASPKKSVFLTRAGQSSATPALWDDHYKAAAFLVEIEDFIRQDPEWYGEMRANLNATWSYLTRPEVAWTTDTGTSAPFPDTVRGALLTAGRQISRNRGAEYRFFNLERVEALRETLQQIRTAIESLPAYLLEHRDYLLGLLEKCLKILESDSPDLEQARALTFEIVGAAMPAAVRVEPDEAKVSLIKHLSTASGLWMRDVSVEATAGVISGSILSQLFPQISS